MNRSLEQLHALVRYRLQQAVETLREARLLLDQSAWRSAQNRAYYAMFYAVSALLATRQLGSSKHSGVLGLFDREFVKPGLLPTAATRCQALILGGVVIAITLWIVLNAVLRPRHELKVLDF